jgi:predicted alpha/beta-hydrolase family hydrolase
MTGFDPQPLTVMIDGAHSVSGLILAPARPAACYVFAHGAGAGMKHGFMAAVASELAVRNIATLRYQFPYMDRGARRPDPPKLAQATVRGAVTDAGRRLPGLPLIAGGKSFGGRMTSQAQASAPLPGVRGLAFLGFPLHPAKRPSDERAKHLFEVRIPMLFLQGTRDELADVELIGQTAKRLGQHATLHLISEADHSFHVPARSGRSDADVQREIMDVLVAWIGNVISGA